MSDIQPDESPLVSIIIPVLNKLTLTKNCLQAIQANTPHDRIEVIVIDNASTDGTFEFFSSWNGPFPLTVIRNEQNRGFARSNNQGARTARGDFLVLLNNDTVPRPNWLPPLMDVFARYENVGAVGAKLLYPDGTIQHAGVITAEEGNFPLLPIHVGYRNQDSENYQKLRRFPAVTGACMMIPKAIYQKAGGLDEGFWNGFEDVDLCFKLLEAGFDIYCQPDSVVIHFESQSGDQRFVREKENLKKFENRWKGRITCQFFIDQNKRLLPNNAVTIVIVTHNSSGTIVECLEHLNKTLRSNDEIVIVDNASTDSTQSALRQITANKDPYRLVLNKHNKGYARAANLGASAGRNPYIIFLSPDSMVTPQWIERLLFHISHHKTAAVGPLSDRVNGFQNVGMHLPDTSLSQRNLAALPQRLSHDYAKQNMSVTMLADFCVMVKRKVFDLTGGMVGCPTDNDCDSGLSQCLMDAGYHLVVAKDTVIFQRSTQGLSSEPIPINRGSETATRRVSIDTHQQKAIEGRDLPVSNQDNPSIFLQQVCSDDKIDSAKLHAAYTLWIDRGQMDEARYHLNALKKHFPNDRNVQQLCIALSIQQEDHAGAMQQIETLMALCAPDDGLLDAALAVRTKVESTSVAQPHRNHGTISLCMVVKNEQAGLGACLNNAKKFADEVIVVDTGSTDRTKDVARIFGARLFDYTWHDDFAAARNYSIDQASGDWILVLDADEIISSQDHEALRHLVSQGRIGQTAVTIETRNYSYAANAYGWQANEGAYPDHEAGTGWIPSRKIRLFPNQDAIRFSFPVHERVEPTVQAAGIDIVDSAIPVHHYGDLNHEKKQQKAKNYFRIGLAKLKQLKDDPVAIRELAVQAGELQMWSDAIEMWQRLLKHKPDFVEAHVNIAGAQWQIGLYGDALESAQQAASLEPGVKEAWFNIAVSHLMLGRADKAVELLETLTKQQPTYLSAHFMLASAYGCLNDLERSRELFEQLRVSSGKSSLYVAVQDLIQRLKRDEHNDHANRLTLMAQDYAPAA